MKATGIIRRVDDLGRVVIPKEIRRSLHIREGDPLEIYTDPREQAICFRKYSPVAEQFSEDYLKKVCRALSTALNTSIVITDTDSVLGTVGNLGKDFFQGILSESCMDYVRSGVTRSNISLTASTPVRTSTAPVVYFVPIKEDYEASGGIWVIGVEELSESEKTYVNLVATLLSEHNS